MMSYIDMRDVFFRAETGAQKQLGRLAFWYSSKQSTTYKIHVWSDWNTRAQQFARETSTQAATLFQNEAWLTTWYDHFACDKNIEPVIVAIECRKTGDLLMLLPLCKYKENGLVVIGFADFGLADYNGPIMHSDFNPDAKQTAQLIHAICKALPPADFLKLEKMPEFIKDRKNIIASLPGIQTGNLNHYGIEITGKWDEYWSGLKRNFRKDQRRRWRVLEKKGEVSFKVCRHQAESLPLFETLTRQQQARLNGLDLAYLLDNPRMKQFYQKIIAQGSVDGFVIFTALLVDGQPVATLCGLGNGHHYAMTLSGYEAGEWSKCSPGRLLTERTMHHLHENGYKFFDFTIGDEPYKKYFAKEQGILLEYSRPLSLKALPRHSWMKLKALQRKSAFVASLKKWLRRKPA